MQLDTGNYMLVHHKLGARPLCGGSIKRTHPQYVDVRQYPGIERLYSIHLGPLK